RRLLHDPAPRRRLRPRARVHRDPEPARRLRRRRRGARPHPLLHRPLRGLRREPELPDRGPSAAGEPGPGLGPRQAGGGAARGGAFNVVPARPIPLLTAYHLAAKVPLAVPHPAAYAASDLLWSAGLGPAPGAFVDYVRFPFVADGEKAKAGLGFTARHSSRE